MTEPQYRKSGFKVPCKRINNSADFMKFCAPSEAFLDMMTFILNCNHAVKGKKISEAPPPSKAIEALEKLLILCKDWIAEIPPVSQNSRFGNKSFRDWQDRLYERAPALIVDLLPEEQREAVVELAPYFVSSFGDRTRIDYGTGHENSFVCFLLCLHMLGIIKDDDLANVVLRVFPRYLEVTRTIQTTYWLEPAGSHGVWGLDDFSFMPFLWGAAQLIGHQHIKPKSIHSKDVLSVGEKDFLYLDAIQFINKMKKGPFPEHSPILSDVSHSCPHWEKVNGGMIKMYIAEVMQKFPVIQHCLFGTLIQFDKPAPEGARLPFNVVVPAPQSSASGPGSSIRGPVGGMMGSMPGARPAGPMGAMPGPVGVMPGARPVGAMGPPGMPGGRMPGAMPGMGSMPMPHVGTLPMRGAAPPEVTGVAPWARPGVTGAMQPPGTGAMPPPSGAPWPMQAATGAGIPAAPARAPKEPEAK